MELKDIAAALVAACREGRESETLLALYAPDAVSVEAVDMGGGRETVGRDGIRGKHDWWNANFDVHEAKVSDPMLHAPDRFAVIFEIDATNTGSGERSRMTEVALYTVGDGRIVREEFFYG